MEYEGYELPKYYKILFDAVEKALDAIDQQNYGIAKSMLVSGQIQAESAFVADSLQRDGAAPLPPVFAEGTTGNGEIAAED